MTAKKWREVPPEIHERITTSQASHILGVTDSRIRQLILGGELAAQKEGGDWLIRWIDLDRLMKARTT